MSKVMIVEDDDSLREIYGIRLTAEGYTVVSARDGEEALAVAVRERPDLIVSDVMMPKISGFDMLDILRSTPETQNIKVIMMTALSSEDQRERGENLGADRYLVKSQVGIEDVVNTVHEVLGDRSDNGTISTSVPTAAVPDANMASPEAAMPAEMVTPEQIPQPAIQPEVPAAEAYLAPEQPMADMYTPAEMPAMGTYQTQEASQATPEMPGQMDGMQPRPEAVNPMEQTYADPNAMNNSLPETPAEMQPPAIQ